MRTLGFLAVMVLAAALAASLVVEITPPSAASNSEAVLLDETWTPPPAPRRAPPEERVRVEVLNASGTSGVARRGTAVLRDAGFDVVLFGNGGRGTEFSVVIDRVGRPDLAAHAAEILGIENVESRPDPSLLVDISVVLAADWTETQR
jgi:hypothetical protein